MFNGMLSLLCKPHKLAPRSSIPQIKGSLQEMTLRVFRAVIHEGCSHAQPTLSHSYTYLDTGSVFRQHIGGCSLALVEGTLTHVCAHTFMYSYSILNQATEWRTQTLTPTHAHVCAHMQQPPCPGMAPLAPP